MLRKNDLAFLKDLQKRADLNGTLGKLIKYHSDKKRWEIKTNHLSLAVKEENLSRVQPIEAILRLAEKNSIAAEDITGRFAGIEHDGEAIMKQDHLIQDTMKALPDQALWVVDWNQLQRHDVILRYKIHCFGNPAALLKKDVDISIFIGSNGGMLNIVRSFETLKASDFERIISRYAALTAEDFNRCVVCYEAAGKSPIHTHFFSCGNCGNDVCGGRYPKFNKKRCPMCKHPHLLAFETKPSE